MNYHFNLFLRFCFYKRKKKSRSQLVQLKFLVRSFGLKQKCSMSSSFIVYSRLRLLPTSMSHSNSGEQSCYITLTRVYVVQLYTRVLKESPKLMTKALWRFKTPFLTAFRSLRPLPFPSHVIRVVKACVYYIYKAPPLCSFPRKGAYISKHPTS